MTTNETDEEFINRIRKQNKKALQQGIDNLWWEEVDWEKEQPINFSSHYILSTRELWKWNAAFKRREVIATLQEHENTFAHLLVKLNVFESISEAKRNGWNKPIELGEFWFKKKTVRLFVFED